MVGRIRFESPRVVWRPADEGGGVPRDATVAETADETLFQTDPPYSRPSRHKPKGWTETVAGYIREAKKLKTQILLNERLAGQPYTWHLTIAFETVLSPSEVKAHRTAAFEALGRIGVVAVWVMEVSRQNHVHFHLVLRNRTSEAALRRAVENAMPSREVVPWHAHPKRIKPGGSWQLAHYVTKAKIAGFVDGRPVADRYRRKRVLFRPKLGLQKTGKIGPFWVRSKKALWQAVRDKEQRIAVGLDRPHVRDLARRVHEMLDGTVAVNRLERSFGYHAGSEAVRRLIGQLIAGEGAYEATVGEAGSPQADDASGLIAASKAPVTGRGVVRPNWFTDRAPGATVVDRSILTRLAAGVRPAPGLAVVTGPEAADDAARECGEPHRLAVRQAQPRRDEVEFVWVRWRRPRGPSRAPPGPPTRHLAGLTVHPVGGAVFRLSSVVCDRRVRLRLGGHVRPLARRKPRLHRTPRSHRPLAGGTGSVSSLKSHPKPPPELTDTH